MYLSYSGNTNLQRFFEERSFRKILGGHTQNANSFNATVWRLAPKHLNCGFKTDEIDVFLAANVFNEDYYFGLKPMETMQIVIGQQCKIFADHYDTQQLQRQERLNVDSTKEVRSARKEDKTVLSEFYKETEGLLYELYKEYQIQHKTAVSIRKLLVFYMRNYKHIYTSKVLFSSWRIR